MAFCRPAASPRVCLACASLGWKPGLLGMAQQSGENRVIMKRSNPGRAGCGVVLVVISAPGGGGDESGKPCPPQAHVMRVRTENASFAVGKSLMSFAKCSTVEMTASNMGWLTEMCQPRKELCSGKALGPDLR